MKILTNAEERGNTVMKNLDIIGIVLYTGLAVLGVGAVVILITVVLQSLIFGA